MTIFSYMLRFSKCSNSPYILKENVTVNYIMALKVGILPTSIIWGVK